MDKDMKKLVKHLQAQGFEVKVTKRGHITVFAEDGSFVAAFAGTPSDWRGIKNGIAAARRAGFRWPP